MAARRAHDTGAERHRAGDAPSADRDAPAAADDRRVADQHLLAAAIEGTDVRTILAGHYHYSAHSTLGSVPVSVAASTCYIIDPAADPRGLRGYDGSQSFDLVHVFDDRVVHSTVPVQPGRMVVDYPLEALEHVAAMSPADRRQSFANASVDVDSMVLVDGDTLES